MKTGCIRALIFVLFLVLGAAPAWGGDADLVDISVLCPDIVVDMRYATADNFLGQPLYAANVCLLRKAVADRLVKAQEYLKLRGLGLKCWDCLRPLQVQWAMWRIVPDRRYVADPRKGSNHNRGVAVDVTLVDARGRELEMPTGFDDFSPRAASAFPDLPAHQKDNRALLRKAMEQAGFRGIRTEWWHFDAASPSAFPIVSDQEAAPLVIQ